MKYPVMRSATLETTSALLPVNERLISSSDLPAIASANPTRSFTAAISTCIALTPHRDGVPACFLPTAAHGGRSYAGSLPPAITRRRCPRPRQERILLRY